MLETKNCIVSEKTALTDPTLTTLVWFEFSFKSQPNQIKPNQTKPHVFLSCGSDDF